MSAIIWPGAYLPGFTDNFASNEVIVAGLSAADIFLLLEQAPLWPSYYANSANIRFHNPQERALRRGARFYFETFGLSVKAEMVGYVPPASGKAARMAWHGWAGEGAGRLDVHMPGGWKIYRKIGCVFLPRRCKTAIRSKNWPTPGLNR